MSITEWIILTAFVYPSAEYYFWKHYTNHVMLLRFLTLVKIPWRIGNDPKWILIGDSVQIKRFISNDLRSDGPSSSKRERREPEEAIQRLRA